MLTLLGLMLLADSGCTLLKPKPAADVLKLAEPDSGAEYRLYKPTNYKDTRAWPLVVLCHASFWQNPDSVIADWAALAEDKGFLLLAPRLSSTADFPSKPDKQLQLQLTDEQAILKSIRHVRASCRVADERVMILGASGGGRAATFIGLRNPDVFRMIALLRPLFDVSHLAAVQDFVDPYQRVLIIVGLGDLFRDQSKACLDWLRGNRLDVAEHVTASRPDKYPAIVAAFFEDSLRKHPWIRIKAYQTASPLAVRFHALASFPKDPDKYEWDFGDGAQDSSASPEHQYAQPGQYEVTLKVYASSRKPHERKIRLRIPAE